MDISVIIVNYNTKSLTDKAITSILQQTYDVTYEIIVVDNNSSDGSVSYLKSKFPDVIIIPSKENLGFGKANNLGLKISKGRYILYLNSDTFFVNNALAYFCSFMDNSSNKIGVCGCVMLSRDLCPTDSNGIFHTISVECKSFISLLVSRISFSFGFFNVQKRIMPFEKMVVVDYVIGADMFLRREVAEQFMFDENIFMYAEEMELQYRLVKAGYYNILIDGPSIVHLEGGSSHSKKKESLFKIEQMTKSLFYVTRKHHSLLYALAFRMIYSITHFSIFLSPKYSKEFKLRFLRLILSKL